MLCQLGTSGVCPLAGQVDTGASSLVAPALPLLSEEGEQFPCTCTVARAALQEAEMCCIPGKEARCGIWPLALSAEVAKHCWLRFIRNSADNLHLLTGLQNTPGSSLQCAASLMEWMGVFSFKINFLLSHELQLKLAKLWFPRVVCYFHPSCEYKQLRNTLL